MSKTLLIIGGGILSGASVVAFALTSLWVGSFALAMVLMFVIGVFNTMQNTALQASMQFWCRTTSGGGSWASMG